MTLTPVTRVGRPARHVFVSELTGVQMFMWLCIGAAIAMETTVLNGRDEKVKQCMACSCDFFFFFCTAAGKINYSYINTITQF